MLRSLKDLEQYTVSATDGDVGTVVNFLFDDERWVVRHLVVETGGFWDGRRVLVSPISFRDADWSTHNFRLALTRDKIRNGPSVDVDKPVSRQHEQEYFGYYGYPYYWGYSGLWGAGMYPGLLATTIPAPAPAPAPAKSGDKAIGDIHLRSLNEVCGYHIEGSDESIGHIDDFIVDDETWEVRYLVIDTNNWWFGKKVLVAPRWASRISWVEKTVHVDLSRQAIKDSPEWNPAAGVNRAYEARLYDYYGRPVYWDSDTRVELPRPAGHAGAHPR
jgi:uncharacterized protein YifN (PemK superfamily)